MSRSENIHVSLRFRPLSFKELEESENMIWSCTSSTVSLKPEWAQYLLDYKRLTRSPHAYTYNHCFSSKDSNLKIYETVAKRAVLASLEGYNGTLFVYGQTGSGKTYTMMGSDGVSGDTRKKNNVSVVHGRSSRSVSPFFRSQSFTPENEKEKGILIYALEDLFSHIKLSTERSYSLSCSYLEIYNEQVYDLLEFSNDVLSVNEDPSKGFYVRGASEHGVSSLQEILKFIEKGEANRKYAATAMNHHSSRSHTIFKLNVTSMQIENNSESNSITTESTVNFVDLAGSERVSSLNQDMSFELKHRSSKSRENLETLLTEGKHINTSLFYLCQVINKLSEKNGLNDSHVPYRNSNLTKILRSSLGGNSLTCIICTAVPTLTQFEMTLSTLRFGGIAKTITNNIEANVKNNNSAELLQTYQKDLENLRKELENAQQGGKAKAEEANNIRKQLEERIAKLTQMLFNQSRQQHISKCFEDTQRAMLWCPPAGDLIIDSHLVPSSEKSVPRFDQKGAFAVERMKSMNSEIRKKDQEISELKDCKQSLLDSKINLKNDLKQALNLCQQLSSGKIRYKEKWRKVKAKNRMLNSKLNIVERHNGLSKLSDEQLSELENFFFHSLDAVKNAKFRKKYESKLSKVQKNTEKLDSPAKEKTNQKMWDLLGLADKASSSSSGEESSLDFETSFYRNGRNEREGYNSFASHDISTLIFENFENEEMARELKGVVVPDLYDNHALVDISSQLLNGKGTYKVNIV